MNPALDKTSNEQCLLIPQNLFLLTQLCLLHENVNKPTISQKYLIFLCIIFCFSFHKEKNGLNCCKNKILYKFKEWVYRTKPWKFPWYPVMKKQNKNSFLFIQTTIFFIFTPIVFWLPSKLNLTWLLSTSSFKFKMKTTRSSLFFCLFLKKIGLMDR